MESADPELFDKAVEVLEQRGWCQGKLEATDGRVCAVGALRAAAWGDPYSRTFPGEEKVDVEPVERALDAVNAVLSGPRARSMIVSFNDEPGRTAEEVIDLFRRVAKDLRNKATPA